MKEKNLSLIIKIFYSYIFLIIFYLDAFSEIDIKTLNLKYHIIVSLTTSEEKTKSQLLNRLIKSLLNQTLKPYKLLLSMNKKDITFINNYLKLLIKQKFVEIIYVNEDFKYLNKYYYIPNKYKEYIIITFDNNIKIEKHTIENLYKSYLSHPKAISARRVFKMNFNEKWMLKPFDCWTKDFKIKTKPKFSLFAIHGEGSLFPPNTLNFTDDFIYYFKNAINGHDFIIKYFELCENLKTVYVYNNKLYSPINIKLYKKYNSIFSISPNEIQLMEDFGIEYNVTIYNNIIKEKVDILNETGVYYLNNINNNKITSDTLLVSMTSYPARIFGIYNVFLSLLNQSSDITTYQCFLTLAKEEFINGVKDLPLDVQKLIENGWIKMIWHHNILSHKKLMPILQKYPENDILIVDDDVKRIYNFIELFQNEHRLYPTDIICGTFVYYYDDKLEMKRLKGYKNNKQREINPVPNIIFQTARPANGLGGVLYPKNTFSDQRFFNETLYTNLSLTSDEIWQYTFIVIENKILRQTSFIIDNSVNLIEKTQKMKSALSIINKKNYPLINDKIINFFPEYKIKSFERQKKILVSLTSNKYRFKSFKLVLKSIFNNTMKPSKIVLTIAKEDFFFLKKN